jgi:hypothetical protein
MSTHHVRPDDLRAWVHGEADAVTSMSLEQHLLRCPQCQAGVAAELPPMAYAVSPLFDVTPLSDAAGHEQPEPPALSAPPNTPGPPDLPDLAAVWTAVRDEIEVPRVSVLERLLVRLGLPPGDAMLVAAAPALRGSWICAVSLAVAFAVGGAVAARNGSVMIFLVVAPLVPVLAVATAFGPEAGPALEQESSAPYPLARLLLLRTAAVLLAALPVVLVGQFVFPESAAWVWLLPALGFTAAVLALSTWFGPWRPASAITVVWVIATGAASRLDTIWAVFAPQYLVLYLLMLLIGPPVLVLRARRLGTIGRIAS